MDSGAAAELENSLSIRTWGDLGCRRIDHGGPEIECVVSGTAEQYGEM